jgi:alpha-mannosidase
MLETVKRAEDGNGLIIRLFEFTNRRGPVQLTLAGNIDRAEVCDLMERPLAQPEPIMVDGSSISFAITPYEIKTFRVVMKI